ncbi:uncharacterized protein LOC120625881 [Pararge aegeria]|uniref:Jg26938 protein n=1 Tax=Pararge aegeria aegeria TaxID=348720 RepID=A0A8S4QQ41_9NEOP|nr:uncharacterized protein LOC120625881 [Pararge aegeria]CAH2216730.1 jg26938 [Pararge aegeria aegeria]
MAVIIKVMFLVLVIFALDFCTCNSLQVGTTVNGQLAYVDTVKLSSIPLKVRTKNVFFNGNHTIKGIMVLDMAKTKAKASLTSGGVGSTFANIKMKSERGGEINFQIQIFV